MFPEEKVGEGRGGEGLERRCILKEKVGKGKDGTKERM
jgi:hypothetical protein